MLRTGMIGSEVTENVNEAATILNDIGNTPLLKLRRVTAGLGVDIYVKCEFTNPGGSIKDRMALCMIEEAEKRGELKPGGTIVDQSTGNIHAYTSLGNSSSMDTTFCPLRRRRL